uniref:CHASE2 domain-containing protein n=1 Tax=Sedimenticola sp. TaxID=1940285 RepID=UPI003D13838A
MLLKRALKQKYLAPALLIGAVAALVSLGFVTGAFDRLEHLAFDKRMQQFRHNKQLPDEIAIIMIDEASVTAMNSLLGRFPWPRAVYGDLLEFLALGGARAVIFDVLFTENERGADGLVAGTSPSDARLVVATEESGVAIHAAQLIADSPDQSNAGILNRPLPDVFVQQFSLPTVKGLPETRNNFYLLPFDGLWQASAAVGIVGVDPDEDGVYRRLKPVHGYGAAWFPGHSLVGLLDRVSVKQVELKDGHLRLDGLVVPVDEEGQFLVNLYGHMRSYSISGIFSSLARLKAGDVEGMKILPDEFAEKIVYVGASAVGLEDVKPTALSGKTPGVMLHASAAGNFLTNDFLRVVPRSLTLLLILAFSVTSGAAIFYTSNFWIRSGMPLLLAVGYLGIGIWQFEVNLVFHLVAPLVAMVLSWLVAFAYLSFTEGKDRKRVHKMFSQYVNEAVLSEVMDNYESFLASRVGKREELSVLFSDIRGFTTISESLEPEQVVELLNCHFDKMTDVIFENRGTLDKFIGDAIMAFWGAPVRVANHADLAM